MNERTFICEPGILIGLYSSIMGTFFLKPNKGLVILAGLVIFWNYDLFSKKLEVGALPLAPIGDATSSTDGKVTA